MAASCQEEFEDTKGVYQNRYIEDGDNTRVKRKRRKGQRNYQLIFIDEDGHHSLNVTLDGNIHQ
jgi:hypothetical protein